MVIANSAVLAKASVLCGTARHASLHWALPSLYFLHCVITPGQRVFWRHTKASMNIMYPFHTIVIVLAPPSCPLEGLAHAEDTFDVPRLCPKTNEDLAGRHRCTRQVCAVEANAPRLATVRFFAMARLCFKLGDHGVSELLLIAIRKQHRRSIWRGSATRTRNAPLATFGGWRPVSIALAAAWNNG